MQEWDRREGETDLAFKAFSAYLEMPKRSLQKLAEKYGKSTAYVRQLERWSAANEWVSRASAWDDHQVGEALRTLEGNQLARRVEIQNEEWTASEALIARAKEINRLPLTERIVTQEVMKDGHLVTQYITINPVKASARDAARLLDMASKLGRLSTGLETDRVKIEMEVQAQLEELLGELRTALSPSAFEEIAAYLFARTGERVEERVLS